MGKREFTAAGDDFLESAGKWFMTTMDIKEMHAKEKRLKEETIYKRKEAKAKAKREIAEMLYKKKHPGKPRETVQRIIYGPEGEDTGTKKVDVTTEYKGLVGKGGKGEASTGQWLTAQRANVDDRANIINKMRGKLSMEPNTQIFIDAAGELDAATRYEEMKAIYDKAIARMKEIPEEEREKSIWIDTAEKDLKEYMKLTDWRLYYEMKIGGVPKTTTREAPTTEIPITGAGEGAPDEVLMMDEIIKGIK
jgi:hypothetical protein